MQPLGSKYVRRLPLSVGEIIDLPFRMFLWGKTRYSLYTGSQVETKPNQYKNI